MEYTKINEFIREKMKEKGIRQLDMAHAIGKDKATDVSARLISTNPTFKNVTEMLNILDYEIVIRPKQKKHKDNEIVVTEDTED